MGSGASNGSKPEGKPMLYISPFSAPCRAVMMTCKAANIPYDSKEINLITGEQKKEEFTAINPDHTVPTVKCGSFVLWESRAIMRFMVDAYASNNPIYPRDLMKRAQVDRLLDYDLINVYKHVSTYIYPQVFEHKAADEAKRKEVETVLAYLDNILQKSKFVAGDAMTIADLSIMANISLLELKNFDFGSWNALSEWRKRLEALPYYAETNTGLQQWKEMVNKPA